MGPPTCCGRWAGALAAVDYGNTIATLVGRVNALFCARRVWHHWMAQVGSSQLCLRILLRHAADQAVCLLDRLAMAPHETNLCLCCCCAVDCTVPACRIDESFAAYERLLSLMKVVFVVVVLLTVPRPSAGLRSRLLLMSGCC